MTSWATSSDPRNSQHTYQHATAMACVVANSACSSLAADAACFSGRFHVKWDTQ
jgi:hypothetical protein